MHFENKDFNLQNEPNFILYNFFLQNYKQFHCLMCLNINRNHCVPSIIELQL